MKIGKKQQLAMRKEVSNEGQAFKKTQQGKIPKQLLAGSMKPMTRVEVGRAEQLVKAQPGLLKKITDSFDAAPKGEVFKKIRDEGDSFKKLEGAVKKFEGVAMKKSDWLSGGAQVRTLADSVGQSAVGVLGTAVAQLSKLDEES